MSSTDYYQRRQWERSSREVLRAQQLRRLNRLLAEVAPRNPYFRQRMPHLKLPLRHLEELEGLPLTTKSDLVASDEGRLPSNRTYAAERYARLHRTSGTHGRPLTILDTAGDWSWWIDTWQYVLDTAGVTPADRALMAFSFGPFIGFWSACDALASRGAMVIPAGGLTTEERLDLLRDSQATLVCCTPTYALRMHEVAHRMGRPLAESAVRCLIVAGEPGGSLPAVRHAMQSAWGAEIIDHAGATEVGPWGYANADRSGLHVIESEFIAEFLPLAEPHGESDLRELVLTALGRCGMPAIRYRTGDTVRPTWLAEGDNRFVFLQGGVLGRVDDMLVVRGVNVFPSAIEAILREWAGTAEFRITLRKQGAMDELMIELENASPTLLQQVADQLRRRLGLRVTLQSVPAGQLPRAQAKSRRLLDLR